MAARSVCVFVRSLVIRLFCLYRKVVQVDGAHVRRGEGRRRRLEQSHQRASGRYVGRRTCLCVSVCVCLCVCAFVRVWVHVSSYVCVPRESRPVSPRALTRIRPSPSFPPPLYRPVLRRHIDGLRHARHGRPRGHQSHPPSGHLGPHLRGHRCVHPSWRGSTISTRPASSFLFPTLPLARPAPNQIGNSHESDIKAFLDAGANRVLVKVRIMGEPTVLQWGAFVADSVSAPLVSPPHPLLRQRSRLTFTTFTRPWRRCWCWALWTNRRARVLLCASRRA